MTSVCAVMCHVCCMMACRMQCAALSRMHTRPGQRPKPAPCPGERSCIHHHPAPKAHPAASTAASAASRAAHAAEPHYGGPVAAAAGGDCVGWQAAAGGVGVSGVRWTTIEELHCCAVCKALLTGVAHTHTHIHTRSRLCTL